LSGPLARERALPRHARPAPARAPRAEPALTVDENAKRVPGISSPSVIDRHPRSPALLDVTCALFKPTLTATIARSTAYGPNAQACGSSRRRARILRDASVHRPA